MQVQGFQVNALIRKSWAYQRKNVSSLLCILLAPIVIATLLGVLQSLVNNLLRDKGKVCSQTLNTQSSVLLPLWPLSLPILGALQPVALEVDMVCSNAYSVCILVPRVLQVASRTHAALEHLRPVV